MHDLTPTQTAVLTTASTRPRQIALPLPGHLPAGAQAKVVAALLLRGLLTEAAPAPGDPLWRDTGRTLVLSSAGMEAIGFDPVVIRAVAGQKGSRKASSRPEPQPTETPSQADLPPTHKASVANAPAQADGAKAPEDRATTAKATSIAAHTTEPAAPDRARSPRTGTKQATLIAMLRAPDGASLTEIAEATGWQPHTIRGAIAGALKKRLGLNVTSDKHPERGRVYRSVD